MNRTLILTRTNISLYLTSSYQKCSSDVFKWYIITASRLIMDCSDEINCTFPTLKSIVDEYHQSNLQSRSRTTSMDMFAGDVLALYDATVTKSAENVFYYIDLAYEYINVTWIVK